MPPQILLHILRILGGSAVFLTLRSDDKPGGYLTASMTPNPAKGTAPANKEVLVKHAPGTSIELLEQGNRIENCVVTEGCRHGRRGDSIVSLEYDRQQAYDLPDDKAAPQPWEYRTEQGNTIEYSTIFMCGIGAYLLGPGPGTAEFNHVFQVGLYCSDVSALSIPQGNNRAWLGFHHNWLHDINGMGLRCDQDGQQVRLHHNHLIRPEQQAALVIGAGEESPDLRPMVGSLLIDQGVAIPGINDGFLGDAPDVGAYEHGGLYWTAGAAWWTGTAPDHGRGYAPRPCCDQWPTTLQRHPGAGLQIGIHSSSELVGKRVF